jgi:integrase
MLAVAKGRDPAAEKSAERGAGTFSELAAKYLAYAEKKNKSWKQAAALVARHAIPRWKKLQASLVNRSDIKQMMSDIKAPVVANQTLAAVSAIFTWGLKEDIVAANPCKLIDRNETQSRKRVLKSDDDDSEIPKFWTAFDDAGLIKSTALKTILLTGQRPGEVRHMRWEHIKNNWWDMPSEPQPETGWPGLKNAKSLRKHDIPSHRVWLPQPVMELLKELSDDDAASGFVFTSGRGNAVRGLDEAMRTICKTLDVARATPHDLRRTHGSTITALGFGRDAMNRVQNHIEGGMGAVYDRHNYEVENKTIMEAVAAKIMSLIEPPTDTNVVRPQFSAER